MRVLVSVSVAFMSRAKGFCSASSHSWVREAVLSVVEVRVLEASSMGLLVRVVAWMVDAEGMSGRVKGERVMGIVSVLDSLVGSVKVVVGTVVWGLGFEKRRLVATAESRLGGSGLEMGI
jgi:hypothetical protein